MKRKLVPSFIMLFAGALTSIVMFLNHYEIKTMLWILVGVLVSFYIIGVIIKKVMDSFEKAAEDTATVSDEGEVIEKETAGESVEEKEQQGIKEE
ncbi:MAG: hypothetical protein PHS74_06285 [Lachnospiraceae bacterium]|nr:hypothetical protein [Lachnospiraceae bacterium]